MTSPRLSLPYIAANQAQKEITHNDALNDLDSLAQISVITVGQNTPPGSPAEGDSYILGSSPTGAWAGNANKVASYYSGWRIKTPREGWSAWAQDTDRRYLYDGSAWVVPNQIIAASGYLNFGSTAGTAGYGLRDNAGSLEFKNSGGTWAGIGSGTGGGTVNLATSVTGVLGVTNGGAGTASGILKANGSGTVSAASAGTDYLTASSTNTLTNKTFDTAGSGNSFSINGLVASANTGTGSVVRATSPSLVTPALGVASATSLTASGNIQGAGITATNNFYASLPAGSWRQMYYQTSGSHRWSFGANDTAESGSNAGSNFVITAYDDAGSFLGNAMQVTRSSNLTAFPGVNSNTTSNSANVNVDASGNLKKSTSSRRYKKDIEDYARGLDDLSKLRPVIFRSALDSDSDRQHAGLIAEEVHEAGLQEFVVYNESGLPDALEYQNMVALLINVAKAQGAEMADLKTRLARLEA